MTGATHSIERYFDGLANDWSFQYKTSPHFKERYQIVEDLLQDCSPGNALDLGCGSGYLSMLLAKKGFNVNGIDISAKMIDAANQAFTKSGLQARFSVGDASSLDATNETFDLATCLSVLEWIEDDDAAINEICRVLKTGGKLIVSVPNATSLARKLEKQWFLLKQALGFSNPGYLRFQKHQYIPRAFDERLALMGLRKEAGRFFVAPLGGVLSQRQRWGMMYCGKYVKD